MGLNAIISTIIINSLMFLGHLMNNKKTLRTCTPLALGLKWVGGAKCWGGMWLVAGWWWWWNKGGMELGWNGICGRLQAGMCCMLQEGSCTLHPGIDHVGAVLHTGWWAPVHTGRWGPAHTGIAYGAMDTGVLTGTCKKTNKCYTSPIYSDECSMFIRLPKVHSTFNDTFKL